LAEANLAVSGVQPQEADCGEGKPIQERKIKKSRGVIDPAGRTSAAMTIPTVMDRFCQWLFQTLPINTRGFFRMLKVEN
jgi:hypothetical protein